MQAGNADHSPAEDRLVGVVVPHDMALDRELWRWAPPDVSLLFNRTPHADLPVTVELAEVVGEVATVARATGDLRTVGPAAYAYACTSGSFIHGVDGELRLREAMRSAGGAEAVTTSGALVEALSRLDVCRVGIATPYNESVTDRLGAFLGEAGFAVVTSAHLGLTSEIWKVRYEETTRLVCAADSPEAEAIVVSCTNLATYDVIAQLEEALGKPVVTANQATMWAALARAGRSLVGPGQRLASVAA